MKLLSYLLFAVLLLSASCKKKDNPPSGPSKKYRLTNTKLEQSSRHGRTVTLTNIEYNKDGNVSRIEKTDSASSTLLLSVTYEYDVNGRLQKEIFSSSSLGPVPGIYSYNTDYSIATVNFPYHRQTYKWHNDVIQQISSISIDSTGLDSFQSIYNLEYNPGNNLQKVFMSREDSTIKLQTILAITHDSKPNPLLTIKGLIDYRTPFHKFPGIWQWASANNITYISESNEGSGWTGTISYQYHTSGYPSKASFDFSYTNNPDPTKGSIEYTYETY